MARYSTLLMLSLHSLEKISHSKMSNILSMVRRSRGHSFEVSFNA
jgi:hypothetical protein